jgi:prepilin-type N-terminal cleavage/methylation domain-containing protein
MDVRGFSLVETLIATMILAVAATALAQLFVLSARANQIARATTMETLLAQEKIEDLRAEPILLPGGSLARNESGFSDAVSGYTRRWSVDPLSPEQRSTFVVQVLVTSPLPGDVRLVALRSGNGGP